MIEAPPFSAGGLLIGLGSRLTCDNDDASVTIAAHRERLQLSNATVS
jgi:hypothetical protein